MIMILPLFNIVPVNTENDDYDEMEDYVRLSWSNEEIQTIKNSIHILQ